MNESEKNDNDNDSGSTQTVLNTLRRYTPENPFLRILLMSAVSGLTGSAFLVLVNNFALYKFAHAVGIRIPVEGSPYIGFAVALVTFAFISGSIIVSGVVIGFYKWIDAVSAGHKYAMYTLNLLAGFATSLGLILTINGMQRTFMLIAEYGVDAPEIAPQVNDITRPMVYAIFAAVSLTLVLHIRPKFRRRTASISAAIMSGAVIVVFMVFMFNTSIYGAFLREIRFGGGIPATVRYQDADNTAQDIDGRLMLFTSSGLVIRQDGMEADVEIFRDRIATITYPHAVTPTED